MDRERHERQAETYATVREQDDEPRTVHLELRRNRSTADKHRCGLPAASMAAELGFPTTRLRIGGHERHPHSPNLFVAAPNGRSSASPAPGSAQARCMNEAGGATLFRQQQVRTGTVPTSDPDG
jgi:hypothetical protein